MGVINKKLTRLRRAKKTRARIRRNTVPALQVHRTANHIYAQVINFHEDKSNVLAIASTLEKTLRDSLSGSKQEKAKSIGKEIAIRAVKAGVKKVAFDRSGFKYHGRIKALADAARENGLEF